MSLLPDLRIVNADSDRVSLEPILRESFEGWYLRHSLKTLGEIERVRIAEIGDEKVGLTMLKIIEGGAGYLYYLAVARAHRGKGIGGRLIDDAVECLREEGAQEVYASTENERAAHLFSSKGFAKTDFGEVSKRYGLLKAVSMYRNMLSVPGEALFRLELNRTLNGHLSSSRV